MSITTAQAVHAAHFDNDPDVTRRLEYRWQVLAYIEERMTLAIDRANVNRKLLDAFDRDFGEINWRIDTDDDGGSSGGR